MYVRAGAGETWRSAVWAVTAALVLAVSPPAAGQDRGDPDSVPTDTPPRDTLAADSLAAVDTEPPSSFGPCPDSLEGPVGAPGIAWGDTLAALSRLAAEMDAEPLPTAGAGPLLGRGDEAFGAGRHTVAYVAYAAAARADEGAYPPLWKTARAAVDVGLDAGEDAGVAWYGRGEEWARRAAEAAPDAPEGHLQLARALGLVALDAGVRERVRLSEEIREEARAAVEADSSYAGGWHVLGRWNRGVMELSGAGRFFARTFLGGDVLGEASWEKAARYLERAAELEPDRILHHLELGKVHAARERPAEARAALERVLSLPPRDYHDCVYREEAREMLSALPAD